MTAPAIEKWAVDKLMLDPENPRLPPEFRTGKNQSDLIRYFETNYDLEEIGWSMAEHGYFDEEPLLTISEAADSQMRVVIEGTRRLATLKLIADPAVRASASRPGFWGQLAERAQGHDLSEVPTRLYASRAELLDYLGFRHVSGLLQWTPEAKARFVHSLIMEHSYDFPRAARVIGSRKDAIRRQFIAWRALEQARVGGVDTAPAIDHFGVYYRALQNPKIRDFIGLQGWVTADNPTDVVEPLPADSGERVTELLGYMFGPKRVVRDSRQLDDLGDALSEAPARAVLKEQRDLDSALQELPASRDSGFVALRAAYRQLARANGEAFQFVGDEEFQQEVGRIRAVVNQLARSLKPGEA